MKSKSISSKPPGKSGKFDGVVIGDDHREQEKTEFLCSWCNRSLVRLSDKNNQSESWFCRACSIEFDPDDENISHKQKLSIPYQDNEPCVSTTPGIPDISIRLEPELRGAFAQLAKKGTIRFTDYHTTEKE